jgi:hypothetical protein
VKSLPNENIPTNSDKCVTRLGNNFYSYVDLFILIILSAVGFIFLKDTRHWADQAYVGTAQFGDAGFWWGGAIHFAQGIIANNPNLNYRMGYAIFGGSMVSILGPSYILFHKVLISVLLAVAFCLYIQVSQLLGRIVSFFLVCSFILNPYTAEWIAISTSDGFGLILNLSSLITLIIALRSLPSIKWLLVFGVICAAASLTRPLMNPFFLPAIITVAAKLKWNPKLSFKAILPLTGVFILINLTWMSIMAASTGNFALTGESQDSSALYAASDPNIQVWNPTMYIHVQDMARKAYKVNSPSLNQLNHEFWALTLENYKKHWLYHVKRLWPHIKTIASLTPDKSDYGTALMTAVRLYAKIILIALLGFFTLRKKIIPGVIILILGACWIYLPNLEAYIVVLAGISGLFSFFSGNYPVFIFSAYWWVGVLALYITGGTCSDINGNNPYINALGYRLGTQFFFINDFLAIGLFAYISQIKSDIKYSEITKDTKTWSPYINKLLLIYFILLSTTLTLGIIRVGSRIFTRSHLAHVNYPELNHIAQRIPDNIKSGHTISPVKGINPLLSTLKLHSGSRLITTAMSSGFVYNIESQNRALLLLYQQDYINPVEMSPRDFFAEVSRDLPEDKWMTKQGAWLLRSFADAKATSNLPHYTEYPSIQGFIPLTSDKKDYDLSKAVYFPVSKYASVLNACNELSIHGGQTIWANDYGGRSYIRGFGVKRTPKDIGSLEIEVNLTHTRGNKVLKYGWKIEHQSNQNANNVYKPQLELISNEGAIIWRSKPNDLGADIKWVKNILDNYTQKVTLKWLNPSSEDTLWLCEFNLIADDYSE